jgi:hypothetical protein
MHCIYTEYTQKNGAVSIVFTIETAPLFCVYPVYNRKFIPIVKHVKTNFSFSISKHLSNCTAYEPAAYSLATHFFLTRSNVTDNMADGMVKVKVNSTI